MKLNRAKLYLESQGYMLEDTDELDDADLGVGVDPKEYHAQKAKQMPLTLKIEHALAQVKKEINADADKFVQMVMSKMNGLKEADARFSKKAKDPDKFQAPRWAKLEPDEVYGYEKAAADKLHHFSADNNGMAWLHCPNTVEYAKLAWMDGRQKKNGNRSLDIRDWKKSSEYSASKEREWMAEWDKYFAKQLQEMERQIKQKGTVTIYRGTGIGEWRDGSTHSDSAHFDDTRNEAKLLSKFKLMLRNAKLRNSWSMNPSVAIDYAGDHEYRYLMVMEAYPHEYSLPFSAYLEGFWMGWGSSRKTWSANDELNMLQSFKVRDIKIIALGESPAKFFRKITKTNCLFVDDRSPSGSTIKDMVSKLTFKENTMIDEEYEPAYMRGDINAWDRHKIDTGRAPSWAKRVVDQGAINKKNKEHRVAGSTTPSEYAMRRVTDPSGRTEPFRETDLKRQKEWLVRGLEQLKDRIETHIWFDFEDISITGDSLCIHCGPQLTFRIENTGAGWVVHRAGGSVFDNKRGFCKTERDIIEWMSDQYHDAEQKGQI